VRAKRRNAFNFIYLCGIDLFICINLTRLRQQLRCLQAINCLHCSTQVRCLSLLFLSLILTILLCWCLFFIFIFTFLAFLHLVRTSQHTFIFSIHRHQLTLHILCRCYLVSEGYSILYCLYAVGISISNRCFCAKAWQNSLKTRATLKAANVVASAQSLRLPICRPPLVISWFANQPGGFEPGPNSESRARTPTRLLFALFSIFRRVFVRFLPFCFLPASFHFHMWPRQHVARAVSGIKFLKHVAKLGKHKYEYINPID